MSSAEEPRTCTCSMCQSMCWVPCWPTPKEASKLIGLGYAKRMSKHTEWNDQPTQVIAPAKKRRGGLEVPLPNASTFRCNFFTKQRLCELHNVCKPFEGRMVPCDAELDHPNYGKLWRAEIIEMWDSWQGDRAASSWHNSLLAFQV
jgi:hypothetical protein